MLWALLAFLGIPLWIIASLLVGALLSRRHFRGQEGVLPVVLREVGEDWPSRPGYGRYVHHVLIVNQGLAQVRTSILVVEEAAPLDLGDQTFKKIENPVGFTLKLEDGAEYEIAVDGATNPIPTTVPG
ncbi:MAG: hypothetical protein ACR2PK_15555 [Acidimicrobiales bacterium]